MTAAWNEARARRRLAAAYRWADRTPSRGCWRSLPGEARETLQRDMEAAYRRIDVSFTERDVRTFEEGLEAFRAVITAAIAEFGRRERTNEQGAGSA